jgi:prophage regulatory protein
MLRGSTRPVISRPKSLSIYKLYVLALGIRRGHLVQQRVVSMGEVIKFLRFPELAARGIPFSRQHIQRLIAAGKFPKPVKLGAATNGFLEKEIDAWCAEKIAIRGAGYGHE